DAASKTVDCFISGIGAGNHVGTGNGKNDAVVAAFDPGLEGESAGRRNVVVEDDRLAAGRAGAAADRAAGGVECSDAGGELGVGGQVAGVSAAVAVFDPGIERAG